MTERIRQFAGFVKVKLSPVWRFITLAWVWHESGRNKFVTVIGVFCLALALFSAPIPSLTIPILGSKSPTEIFTPSRNLYFSIQDTLEIIPPADATLPGNSTEIVCASSPFSLSSLSSSTTSISSSTSTSTSLANSSSTVSTATPSIEIISVPCFNAYGFVEVSGKGGFSVGNPMNLSITMSIPNAAAQLYPFTKIEFIPDVGLDPSFTINKTIGLPQNVHIWLNIQKTTLIPGYTTWAGSNKVEYSSSGNLGGAFTLYFNVQFPNGTIKPMNSTNEIPDVIQIASPDVTEQILSNSLTISLTFVIVALTFFTLRSGDKRNQCQSQQTGDNAEKPNLVKPK